MPRHIEDEIRANTPQPQGLVKVADGETARVTARGQWICDGNMHGPGGDPEAPKASSEAYPLPGANQSCLIVCEVREDGERRAAFTRDDECLTFTGPCTLGFVCNDHNDRLDENFDLVTVSVDIAP